MKRRFLAVLCLFLAVCLLVGCDSYPEGNSFTYQDLTITLPGDFEELYKGTASKDADFFYGRDTLIVMGLSEKKSDLKPMSLEEYTAYVIQGNELTCTPERSGTGYVFSYEATVSDTSSYTYVVTTFAGDTNFWILQFYCPTEKFHENKAEIDMILEGIKLNASKGN